ALENGVISRTQYSIAVIREFLCNRSFVSLTAYELLLLCQQGGATLRHGLQRFKQYLSSPSTEFGSAVNITFDFLELQAMQRTQVTALMELLEHLLEAMLRHPECRADVLLSRAQDFASDIAWKAARPLSTCPPAWDTRRRRYEFLEVALLRAIATARDHAACP